jgi:hypothetical protein
MRTLYQGIAVPESDLISKDGTLLWRASGAIPEGSAGVREAISREAIARALDRAAMSAR